LPRVVEIGSSQVGRGAVKTIARDYGVTRRMAFAGNRWSSVMAEERRYEMGTGGFCVCPKCGERIPHQRGVPCQKERCPECGAKMLREGSFHHQLWKKKTPRRRLL
jgi:hypothetical protein